MKRDRLSAHDERAIAVRSFSDPRTVRKYLEGKPVRGTTSARIAQALRETCAPENITPAFRIDAESGLRPGRGVR